MRQFATETGLSREAIYKSFRPGGNPTIETINKALKVARSKIAVRPGESDLKPPALVMFTRSGTEGARRCRTS